MSRIANNQRMLLGAVILLLVTIFNTMVFPTGAVSAAVEPSSKVKAVREGGFGQSFVIKDDGTVWGWGQGTFSQLGDGREKSSLVPVQVSGLTNVIDVQTEVFSSKALKDDGTVWTWGFQGTPADSGAYYSTPVQIPGLEDNVSSIWGQLALKDDGTVWVWNRWYPLSELPVRLEGLTDVISVFGTGSFLFAIKGDGSVWALNYYYGDTLSEQHLQVTGLTDVRTVVSSDGSHYFALRDDGSVWSWEMGWDNGEIQITRPVQATELTGVQSIHVGYDYFMENYVLALKTDGTVWSWGNNAQGQLGDGTETDRTSPVQVTGLTNVTSLATAGGSSIALKDDGTIWTWGSNGRGQLGDGTMTNRAVPVQVHSGSEVVAIYSFGSSQYVLESDGTLWVTGDISYEYIDSYGPSSHPSFVKVPFFGKVTLAAAGKGRTVELNYGASVEAARFVMKRGTEILVACPSVGSNLTCHDRGLEYGTPYTYTVEAYDASNNLIESKSQMVTLFESSDSNFDVVADETVVVAGDSFTTNVRVNGTDLFAEDVTITYDPALFDFVKAEVIGTGLKIYHQSESTPGKVRVVVASQGAQYGINGLTDLLKLTWQAKDVEGGGGFHAHGLVANSYGEERETYGYEGSYIQVVVRDPDVNSDGRVSLGDLAIAGYHYGMDKPNWTHPKADYDRSNAVDDIDLSAIVEAIFNNAEQ